jgi:D-alanyl-D-alanine carboxypeptidase (penicillin-binding protein 5/6)
MVTRIGLSPQDRNTTRSGSSLVPITTLRVAVSLLIALLLPSLVWADATMRKYAPHHKAALLADAETGRILYANREHRKIYPASLVKLMSTLLTLEAIEEGKTSLDSRVKTSRRSSKIGGTQVYLAEGEVFPLREMMKAMIVRSANDATAAIAEHIAGSQENFVKMMNDKARELGMKDTRFQSVHGLPPSRGQKHDITTAYDLYLLAMHVLRNHPRYLEWSSIELDSFRNGEFQLVNTNRRLMRAYEGMDGMKTGYYYKAGFNLISTAKRDDVRLVSVVIGSPNVKWRSRITSHLMNKGFFEYESKVFAAANEPLSHKVRVDDGAEKEVSVVPQVAASLLVRPNEVDQVQVNIVLPEKVSAPVKQGHMLGTLELRFDGKTLRQVPLVAAKAVEQQSFFGSVAESIQELGGVLD